MNSQGPLTELKIECQNPYIADIFHCPFEALEKTGHLLLRPPSHHKILDKCMNSVFKKC